MKRRVVLFSALIMIGIISGIAISQLISNTANFSVKVDGSAPLNVQKLKEPSGTLYQDQWYNNSVLLNVSNQDTNQGYDFYLVIKIVHSGIQPSFIYMEVNHSLGTQNNYGSATSLSFSLDPSPNTISATYLFSTPLHLDPQSTGQWKAFFMFSFKISSATSGTYNFYFSAQI